MTIQDLINELEGLGSLITQYVTGTWEQYNALQEKDEGTLYYITDKNVIYKGSTCYSGVKSISSEVKNDTDNKENEYYKITISPAVGEDIILNIKTIEAIDKIEENIYNTIQTVQDNLDNHINTISDGEISAHVTLSDETNSESGVDGGIAATPKAVKEALRLAKEYAEETMAVQGSFEVLKGYITTNGIIESAEDTNINGVNINSLIGYEKGWAFFVKAAGHYVGEDCEINDKIICVNNYSGSFKASDFIVLQANIDGAVTSTEQLTEDTLILGSGGHSIKPLDNGADKQVMTMVGGKPQWSDNVDTDTTYTFEDGVDGSFNVKPKDGQTQKINIGKPSNASHADTAGTADKVAQSETTATDIPFLLRDSDGNAKYNKNFSPNKFNEYLPLAGGTMLGDIDMSGNEIKNSNLELVENLPTNNLYEGRQVTYEGKIYTYHNEKWISTADDLGDLKETLSSEFVFRPTADTYSVKDEFASVRSIKGNTVVWNQMFDYSNIIYNNATYDSSTGVFTCTPTSQGFILQSKRYAKINHYHFISLEVKSDSNAVINVWNGTLNPISINSTSTWQKVTSILKCTDSTSSLGVASHDSVNPFEVKNIKAFDLTQMFGEGNEPTTVEEFEKLYSHLPIDYNEGSLLNLNADSIKSVGFNQWDEEWELGVLNTNTGLNSDYARTIRTKNFIPIIQGQDYYVSNPYNVLYIFCYDSSKNYLRFKYRSKSGKLEIVENTSFIKFYIEPEGNKTMQYNNDICINLSHNGERDGEYQSYEEHIVNLPIKKYFPDGLKSAGTAYDEIVFDKNIGKYKAIQRIGSVDLGTLSWTNNPTIEGHWRFYAIPQNNSYKPKTTPTELTKPNCLCVNYNTITPQSSYTGNKGMSINNGTGYYLVTNESFTDVTSLKASLQGQILYYELAEPIETIIEDCDLIAYKANDWGTEEVLSEEPTTPIKADIEYNFDSNEIIKYNYFRIDDFRKNYLRKDETAASAEKLANPRKITLAGDVKGETSFDGSGNVEIDVELEKNVINDSIETIDTINYTDPSKTNIPNEYAIAEAVTGVIQLLTWKTLGDA